jgi:hypothetical protein
MIAWRLAAGEPGLAHPGGAGQQHALVPVDPLAAGQAREQGAREAAGGVPGDVLVSGRLAHAGELEPGAQASVLMAGGLAPKPGVGAAGDEDTLRRGMPSR